MKSARAVFNGLVIAAVLVVCNLGMKSTPLK